MREKKDSNSKTYSAREMIGNRTLVGWEYGSMGKASGIGPRCLHTESQFHLEDCLLQYESLNGV